MLPTNPKPSVSRAIVSDVVPRRLYPLGQQPPTCSAATPGRRSVTYGNMGRERRDRGRSPRSASVNYAAAVDGDAAQVWPVRWNIGLLSLELHDLPVYRRQNFFGT